MNTLARFAGPLALLGGAAWIVAVLVQAAAPLSPFWIGLFASVLLTGGAALGLQRQVGARSGGLGRWGAAATAVGSVATSALVLFIAATGQINATTAPPVLQAMFLVSSLLWLVGSIVFALGFMRGKVISSIAGWLIIVGAVGGVLVLIAGGENPPAFSFVPWVAYGIGWVLVGYAARRPAVDLAIAGRGT